MKNVFYGWWIVSAGFIINAFGIGTYFYGFSTFFNPMIAEFGWSRTLMSGVYSLSRLEGGIEGPLAGWLIDRFGARKMVFIGILIAGTGFILLSFVNSPLSLYVIFGITAMGVNVGYTQATSAAVAKWFIRKRARAIAFIVTGNGVGGAIFVPLIAWLIVQFGWRWAAVAIGVMHLTTALPMGLIVRSTPEEMGLAPDGESKNRLGTGGTEIPADVPFIDDGSSSEEVNLTVREAIKSRAFWTYIAAMIMRSFILSAIVIHQIPHLTDIGIPYQKASSVLGLMVLMSIPGRFIFGWLGDRFNKKIILFLLCLLQGLGIFIFIHAKTFLLLYIFVVIYGLGYGGVIPLIYALRADLFGRKNYATIQGITSTLTMGGTVIAPVVAGYFFDVTQSYTMVFYSFVVMIVLSGIFFLIIPRPLRQNAP